MVKSHPPPRENVGTLWRDGRAAEGACLENMFGSHQRGFESHSLRSPSIVVTTSVVHGRSDYICLICHELPSNSKITGGAREVATTSKYLGRCQSGRMGPPAKRLPGRNPRSQVRILSSPPQKKRVPVKSMERVFIIY